MLSSGRALTFTTTRSVGARRPPDGGRVDTRVKISQAITGYLAQQLCNNTVNVIEQGW